MSSEEAAHRQALKHESWMDFQLTGWQWLPLSVAAGLLLGFSFPEPQYPWLAWIALMPLLMVVYRASFPWTLAAGAVTGIVYFGIVLRWASLFGWRAVTGVTAACALFVVLFSAAAWLVAHRLGRTRWNAWGRFLLIPVLWVAAEMLRSLGPWSFQWALLGSSQEDLMVLQMASLLGVLGISFVLAMSATALTELWDGYTADRVPWGKLGVAVVIIALVFLYGSLRLSGPTSTGASAGRQVTVAVLQGNIPQDRKFASSAQDEILDIYLRLTKDAADQGAKVVVWPESAVPGFLMSDENLMRHLAVAAKKLGVYLLVGSLEEEGADALHNSAFLISPKGHLLGHYRKMRLVPFGEFVPVRALLGRLPELQVVGRDQSPGREFKVFDVGGSRLASVICFESADGLLSRRLVAGGAQMLAVMTNDDWFERTATARQHFELARLRAVENGVPVVQAANTGISGMIDAQGRILEETGLLVEKQSTKNLVLTDERTLYTSVGWLFGYVCVALAGGVVVWLLWAQVLEGRSDAGAG